MLDSEIAIPNAVTHRASSIFSKKYTVSRIKLYEIHLKINGESQAVINKRYREIRQLYETVISIKDSRNS